MAEIEDTGKIWIRGRVRPEYGVRIGDRYFVTGKENNESIQCWIAGEYLCTDLHDPGAQRRTARRFLLSLAAKTNGTLFSGFERTKHADVCVVTFRDSGVEQVIVEGEGYLTGKVSGMSSGEFWATLNF